MHIAALSSMSVGSSLLREVQAAAEGLEAGVSAHVIHAAQSASIDRPKGRRSAAMLLILQW